jgi:hypothetical protein
MNQRFKLLSKLGYKRVHFILNCTPQLMMMELLYPTQFENKQSNYYISSGREPNSKMRGRTQDGEILSFKDGELLCNKEPMCGKCFLMGSVVLVKHCEKHNATKSNKRKRGKKGCECGKVQNPIFNVPNEKKGRWCKNCPDKPPNAIDVVNKKCPCGKQPTFNLPSETVGKWCDNCPGKPPNAIDVKHKKCVCKKARPIFNLPGETVGKWCDNCPDKPANAIDVITERCVCGKSRPGFNVPGETVPIWCDKCPDKPPNAIDVKHKKCPCTKARPVFNLPGETVGIWCDNCPDKPPNAIDVVTKRCPCEEGRPMFNLPGGNIGIWCRYCPEKPENAVDVVTKKCACGVIPTFNLPGETIGIWCDNCEDKPTNAVDVKHKLCNCGNARVNFNIPGEIAQYCGMCRLPGMVLNPRKQCKSCKQLAIFGKNDQRYHCEEHKTEEEFNLVERPCKSCVLMEVLDQNDICKTCDPTNFRNFIKRKEYHIKDLLDAHKFSYIHNQPLINPKCGKERPDFVFDFGYYIVILEVDEHQHHSYPEECERIRMFNMTQSYGGVPVFWIRYNPDDFKPRDKKTKTDISQKKREEHLIEWLKWSFKREMKSLGEVIYLFYDGCDEKTFESDITRIC